MKKAPLILLPILLGILFATGCTTVQPNHAGVVTVFGTMSDKVLIEGFHLTNPFGEVLEVPLTGQSSNFEVAYGSPQVAVSSDRQGLGYSFNISWNVANPNAARQLAYYVNRSPESWSDQIIAPSVQQAVKAVFVGYSLDQILSTRENIRVEVGQEINRLIEERLTGINPALINAIEVNQVNLTNLDWDPQLKDAIEQTQVVAQERLRASQTLEQQTIVMQQRVREAEADRDAAIARANGEAESLRIRAEGLKRYYETLAGAGINPDNYAFLEKWNGTLPLYYGGDLPTLTQSIQRAQ